MSKRAFLTVLISMLPAVPLWPQIVVDTVAGGKVRSGVPAQDVALVLPSGLAWDAAGSIVFCDGNLIRRIRPDGVIETVAGNGTSGFSGDGGPALDAALDAPSNPRFDANGNLYFADVQNHRIRRVDTAGAIASIAGSGILFAPGMDREGPAAARAMDNIVDLAVDAPGNVYFTELNSNLLCRVTPAGRVEIFAGRLASPGWLAMDGAGNLFVADGLRTSFAHILRIAPDGTMTKVAGYGQFPSTAANDDGTAALDAYFCQVDSLAARGGNVYLIQQPCPADARLGKRIRVIDANGVLSTIPEAPVAVGPFGLAADANGNLAIAAFLGYPTSAVVRVAVAGGTVQTVGGGSPKPAPSGIAAREAWFLNATAMAINQAGEIFVAEAVPCLIRKISVDGVLTTAAGTGKCVDPLPGQPNTTQDLPLLASMAFDAKDRLFVLDRSGNSYVVMPDGKIAASSLPAPLGGGQIAIDAKNRLYVMNIAGLIRISPDGTRETIVAPQSPPGFPQQSSGPFSLRAIGVDPARNVYFTGSEYLGGLLNTIFRVNDDGTFVKVVASGTFNELSLAADGKDDFWLANGGVSVVAGTRRLGIGSQYTGYSGDGGLAQEARFNSVMVVARAPNGDLYVLDDGRVRRLSGTEPKSAPAIAAGGIVNAVSYTGGAIAPGELVSIFGSNFGVTGLQVNAPVNNRIPWSLGRTKVLFDGYAGAITAMTDAQINVFAPALLLTPGSSIDVVVQVDGVASAPVQMAVAVTAFGLVPSILNQDGYLNSDANPAARGSVVSLFGTGEGSIGPRLIGGDLSIATPYSKPAAAISVQIGGQPAELLYAGEAPLEPSGVLQINARIPAAVPAGSVPVTVVLGGASSTRQVSVK